MGCLEGDEGGTEVRAGVRTFDRVERSFWCGSVQGRLEG